MCVCVPRCVCVCVCVRACVCVCTQGFGPQFSLHLKVTNMAGQQKYFTHLYLGFHYNDNLYAVTPTHLHIPMLLPAIEYRNAVRVECSSNTGQAENVEVSGSCGTVQSHCHQFN